MHIENWKKLILWKADATLDSTEKQCCVRRTDGEELKNRSQTLPSRESSVALFFCAIKGNAGTGVPVAGYDTSGSESKNRTVAAEGFESPADRGKSSAPTCPACYLRFQAFLRS